MSDRILTEKVKAEILNGGMDLVGFAPVSRWKNAPFLLSPQAILPGSKTVVVGAIHITDTWTEMGGEPEPQDRSPGGWMDQNGLMDHVAYRTSRLLHENGCKAVPVASSNIWRYRKYEGIPSLFAPDLSHIHAAAAAGLAEIGWSGLAITPEFGARCRFISIVTDADLVPTPMYGGPKLCDMCMECVRHCPTSALKKELGKPHEIEIGGKTFRYANKNMWRCAWAEHFNLDLNSENLKRHEKVGEKEILEEIAAKGTRGHERGVCQKFCVPPHLRTHKPSFGRSDKMIAQNRINRRYPDSMPTLRKMRDDISAAAVRMGMDICLVGPLDTESETGRKVLKDAPGMRTVVAVAMRLPPGMSDLCAKNGLGESVSAPFGYAAYVTMHQVLLRLARIVEDCGYHAASYTVHGEAFRLCEMAGLGIVGADGGGIETPEFGKDVLAGAITTDAPLDPTPAAQKFGAAAKGRKLAGRELRRKLESVAEQSLVSLFGVAGAKDFEKTVEDLRKNVDEGELGEYVRDESAGPHGSFQPSVQRDSAKKIRGPEYYVEDARSVIVIGMHFPMELIDNSGDKKTQQIGTYAFWQYQTQFELRLAAFRLANCLSAMGYKAVATEDMLGIGSMVDSPRGKLPDARCNAVEAAAAGLGQIGESGALLTCEYGPHQRRIVVVTDAELPCDKVDCGLELCKHCGSCRTSCPMGALGDGASMEIRLDSTSVKIPKIERHRCDWSKRYSLCPEEGPALIGNNTAAKPPQGRRITINDIAAACAQKDPIMKCRTCILESCMRSCPAGRRE